MKIFGRARTDDDNVNKALLGVADGCPLGNDDGLGVGSATRDNTDVDGV